MGPQPEVAVAAPTSSGGNTIFIQVMLREFGTALQHGIFVLLPQDTTPDEKDSEDCSDGCLGENVASRWSVVAAEAIKRAPVGLTDFLRAFPSARWNVVGSEDRS